MLWTRTSVGADGFGAPGLAGGGEVGGQELGDGGLEDWVVGDVGGEAEVEGNCASWGADVAVEGCDLAVVPLRIFIFSGGLPSD